MMTDKLKEEYWLDHNENQIVWLMGTQDARSDCKNAERHDWEEVPHLSYDRSRFVGCKKCNLNTAVFYMLTEDK